MKQFLSRLRQEKKRAKNRKLIKLKPEVIEALELHLEFLKVSNKGISMNLLMFQKPRHVYSTDA